MSFLIPLFIKYLPLLIQAAQSIPDLTGFIRDAHKHLSQSALWTKEQQAIFDLETEELRKDPAWKPENSA